MPNHCKWPDFCGPPEARVMLDEIAARAETRSLKGAFGPDVLMQILDRIHQCKSPFLRNAGGKHVCDVQKPLPCDELTGIWKRSAPENEPQDPKALPGHWLTIAQELESFPSGT